jgi:hypothetical protein
MSGSCFFLSRRAEGLCLDALDPVVLAIGISVTVVRVKRGATRLLAVVCGSELRICAQMVAEREMAPDGRIAGRIDMKLHAPLAGLPVVELAVTPPRQAISPCQL